MNLADRVLRPVPIIGCERGPDGHNHDLHSESPVCTLYAEPKHSQDTSRCNTKVGEVITKPRADDDAERNMKVSTHRSIEDDWDSDAKTTDGHDRDSVTPGQADLYDRAGSLPSP
jgi:hypothetical protein